MRSVGIRELRQRASQVLRDVERGETFEVTDRGRPVARLTPIPGLSPLEQLRAAGEVSTPTGTFADLPDPLRLLPGQVSPSEILRRLREDER
jgi:prevent-host-death family protein